MENTTTTAISGKHLISSEDMDGASVYGTDGKKIGSIGDLMIERVSGQVTYAIVDFGGFLGLGESHYPLPWSALKYDSKLEGYRTNVTKEQLKSAPEFDEDSYADRNWETRTYKNYGVTPYWNSPSVTR